MVQGRDQPESGLAHLAQSGIRRGRVDRLHDDVELAVAEPSQPLRAEADSNVDMEVGLALLDSREAARQQVGCGCLPGPDGERVHCSGQALPGSTGRAEESPSFILPFATRK